MLFIAINLVLSENQFINDGDAESRFFNDLISFFLFNDIFVSLALAIESKKDKGPRYSR